VHYKKRCSDCSYDFNGRFYYEPAIENFSQAIRLNPNYANAYFGRGLAYYGKRLFDKALTDFESALLIDPNHSNIRDVWLKTKDIKKAQKLRKRK